MLSKKYFLGGTVVGLVLLFSYFLSLPDGRLHITFCSVGQGDATYIRFADNENMLIDGGPDDKVLSCLGSHMPFYDRTIDMVVLTHPQKDHLQGLISVVKRYNVRYFVIGVEGNNSAGYAELVQNIKAKNIKIKNLYSGDELGLGEARIKVYWPEREWVRRNAGVKLGNATMQQCDTSTSLSTSNATMKCNNYINQSGAVLGLATDTELNDFSYFLGLSYGNFKALFPGDGDIHIQPEVLKEDLPDVDILKVPHHGSKTGMMKEFLEKIRPELAVISVGKNSYGHPTLEALNLLNMIGATVRRTDLGGDVEIISNGSRWWTN